MLYSTPFLKTVIIFFFGWGIGIAGMGWIFQRVTKEDQQTYQKLMQQSDSDRESNQGAYQAHQMRLNVHKHFLFSKDQQRLQASLRSRHSELVVNQQNKQTEIIEHFKQMTCQMQEELLKGKQKENISKEAVPEQYVRYIEAERASYSYNTQVLLAEQASLSRYLIPGHEFLTSFTQFRPFMKGKVASVEFILNQEGPAFKARGFEGFWQNEGSHL